MQPKWILFKYNVCFHRMNDMQNMLKKKHNNNEDNGYHMILFSYLYCCMPYTIAILNRKWNIHTSNVYNHRLINKNAIKTVVIILNQKGNLLCFMNIVNTMCLRLEYSFELPTKSISEVVPVFQTVVDLSQFTVHPKNIHTCCTL